MVAEDFQTERAVFVSHIDEWRRERLGDFVLIQGEDVMGFFTTFTEAFDKGTALHGLELFFVQRILLQDPMNVSFFGERTLSN